MKEREWRLYYIILIKLWCIIFIINVKWKIIIGRIYIVLIREYNWGKKSIKTTLNIENDTLFGTTFFVANVTVIMGQRV